MGNSILTARLILSLVAAANDEGTISGVVHVLTAPPAGQLARSADPSDVVVYVTGFSQPAPSEVPRIAQKNKTFIPSVLPIVLGQTVEFTNEDNILHNVFSTSKARTFDLGKPRVGESRRVTFDRTGVVDIYCDIHEQMATTILVLPNRAFALVQPDGKFVLRGIPVGRHNVYAWNQRSDPVQREVEVRPAQDTEVQLELTETKFDMHRLGKYGQPYAKQTDYSK